MTNEEKADELSQYYAEESDYKRTVGYDCAIAMAEWKEKQMIEFLKEFISYHDIVTESDVEDFRKAMEE